MSTTAVSTRRAQTQDKLLDAAVACFAEKGVLASSVEEICERAGFTRGAFYSNFDSKDELCVAVLERKGNTILRAARQATAAVPQEFELTSIDEVIKHAIDVFLAGHPVDPEWLLARSEMRLYALRNPSVRQPLQSVEHSLDDLLEAAITDVLDRLGASLTVPIARLITLLDAYCDALSMESLMADRSGRPDWGDQLVQLLRALVVFPATPR